MRTGMVGIERQRGAQPGDRTVEIEPVGQRDAEIVVRGDVGGRQRDGTRAVRGGIVEVPGESAHLAQIAMVQRDRVVDRDRALDQRDGLVERALAKRDHAAQVQRLAMIGLLREDGVARARGVIEAPCLVVRDRLRELDVDRFGSHAATLRRAAHQVKRTPPITAWASSAPLRSPS